MILVCLLILTDYTLAGSTETRAKFTRLDIGCVLDTGPLPDVVFDHIPVTLLQLGVVGVRRRLFFLMLARKLQKLRKCAPLVVLLEGFALREILEHLEAGRHLLGGFPVKG